MPKKSDKKEKPNFEDALKRLETIVDEMESGDLSLNFSHLTGRLCLLTSLRQGYPGLLESLDRIPLLLLRDRGADLDVPFVLKLSVACHLPLVGATCRPIFVLDSQATIFRRTGDEPSQGAHGPTLERVSGVASDHLAQNRAAGRTHRRAFRS